MVLQQRRWQCWFWPIVLPHLPKAYLAKPGPEICYFRSNKPEQWSTPTSINNYQQTWRLIQRLINISLLLSIGVIVAEKFCLRKCVFVVYKFVLHEKQITCQTDKGNRLKHAQFLQGVPVWRMRDAVNT